MTRVPLGIVGTFLVFLAANCGSSEEDKPAGDTPADAGAGGVDQGEGGSGMAGANAGGIGDSAGESSSAGAAATTGSGGEAGATSDACGGCEEGSGCVDAGEGPECMPALDCDPSQPLSGTISEDVYWRRGVCVLDDDVTIGADARLLIGAGVIVQSGAAADRPGRRPLIVRGQLMVQGTLDEPVVFTARWDTEHAGESADPSEAPAAGAWAGIRFENGGGGSLENAELWYAVDAIYTDGASPTLLAVSVHEASGAAISSTPTDTPKVSGFTSERSGVNGLLRRAGTVDVDTTWDQTELAQVFDGDITVATGTTLTLAEGVVIKSGEAPGVPKLRPLIVKGTLEAKGTFVNPVTFTARWDDELLGEADATEELPAAGAWGGIHFQSESHGKLDYARILFADTAVLATDSSPVLSHCALRNSVIGIRAVGSAASPTISQSRIVDNASGAVAQSSATITATENWWGSPSGPSGAGAGSGDSVSAGVDYSDPLSMPPL